MVRLIELKNFLKSYTNANPQHYVKSVRIRRYSSRYFPAFELNMEYPYVFTLHAGKCGPEYRHLLRNAKVVKLGILTVPSVSVNSKCTGSTVFIFYWDFWWYFERCNHWEVFIEIGFLEIYRQPVCKILVKDELHFLVNLQDECLPLY